MKLVFILLAAAVLRWILLYKVYHSVPALELKRQARVKDKKAAALYKVAVYGRTLDLLLWLLGTAAGALLLIWSAHTNWWLASVFVIVITWLVVWARFSAWGRAGSLAAFFVPFDSRVLSYVDPVLGRVASRLPAGREHSGLFDSQDLLELITQQLKQSDNRIPETDLRIARGAMTFGDKLVRDTMTPRRQMRFVGAGDTVGPMLMDELHKSGHSRFPVVKDSAKAASPQIVGTLYLKDIIGYDGQGKVKDLARKEVYYINEDSSLRQALSAFLKTHHHLLVAVNSFEEVVGVLSIEDVLERIIGKPIVDEFDNYEDLRSVAAKQAKQEEESHQEIQPEKPQPEQETPSS